MELSADKIINPQNHKLNKWLLFKKKDYFVGMKLEARIQHYVGFIVYNKKSHTLKKKKKEHILWYVNYILRKIFFSKIDFISLLVFISFAVRCQAVYK